MRVRVCALILVGYGGYEFCRSTFGFNNDLDYNHVAYMFSIDQTGFNCLRLLTFVYLGQHTSNQS